MHAGDVPEVGEQLGVSKVDGRPWIVHAVEVGAIHLRKGEPDTSRDVRHGITAPPHGSL